MAKRLFRLLLTSFVLVALVLLVRRTMRLRDEAMNVIPSPDHWPPIAELPSDAQADPVTSPEPGAHQAPPLPPAEAEAEAEHEAPAKPGVPPAPSSWVAAVDGACPPTHLIKAKEASGIYHLPGMVNYERTKPDRCYADDAAATADGFTKSKR